jgi:hypothetical protein
MVQSSSIKPAAAAQELLTVNELTTSTTTFPSRRDLLSLVPSSLLASTVLLVPTQSAVADDGASASDLTSQLFNSDGSLKEGVESETKFRMIDLMWGVSDDRALNEDGRNIDYTKSGPQMHLSYELPLKWSDGTNGDPIYFDRTEGTNAKACKRITVYRAPGLANVQQLEKATTIGVAKALAVPPSLDRLYKADIISGRISIRNDQKYYEFDMAAAPESCGSSNENLGLGFCPYDNIYLLSATILDDRLYYIVVECDSTRIWKLASSELKRVRSSFAVDAVV